MRTPPAWLLHRLLRFVDQLQPEHTKDRERHLLPDADLAVVQPSEPENKAFVPTDRRPNADPPYVCHVPAYSLNVELKGSGSRVKQ